MGGSAGNRRRFWFGVLQYTKAERWKRTEFVAKEMAAFFDDPDIRNVLVMIDWAPRRVNLFKAQDTNPQTYPVVSRELQISALVPHEFLFGTTSDGEEEEPRTADLGGVGGRKKSCFTQEEAKIRDAYDTFLDRLELLGTYVREGLIREAELRPYPNYWIKDISAFTCNTLEAAWTCSLLRYIETYNFQNVQFLFARYGANIEVGGKLYRDLLAVPGVKDNLEAALLSTGHMEKSMSDNHPRCLGSVAKFFRRKMGLTVLD